MASLKTKLQSQNWHLGKTFLILGVFLVIGTLEYTTPTEYVFGYLYSGAILLVNSWFGERATLQTTFIAICLTMLNLWIPGREAVIASTVASRVIASMALMVTGFLSIRLRRSQQAITLAQAKLESQEQLVRLREDFASTLTHDLKTPLLGAIEAIKAFQQEKFGAVSPIQQKVLATMVRSHQTSLQFVETLLDVYRNDIEGIKLNLTPVDLVVIAEDVANNLAALASSRRVYINFDYGDSEFRQSLWVLGDTLQLERVFTNLLVNAINHSRRGGHVEVVLESQASHQIVKILDTGAGILPNEFSHLFERFYQGHSDRQAKGSGLGLYLSRQIIEAHGGTIWAENRVSVKDTLASDTTTTGAIFGFRLPVYPHSVNSYKTDNC
ncbi:two-component sensor histidine kinase [Fischerella thermalis CCMEE 5205]|uniref:histidine kinase n=1 Tax=Fischerella sp. MV11 TaxID=397321 RepID=E1U3U3_9CYAN|nr:periplasmic sensor signal transduction histidine kinase [Fischerella sp. MV11]PMB50872.1 two-component sensor histidine kinase [Fischerella thermalis CCMEE 5205]